MTNLDVKIIEELSREASDEIGETNANIVLARKQVREILSQKYPDLALPPDLDDLVDSCLRCRKFDVPSAAAQVDNFYKFLSELYDLVQQDILYFKPSTHNKVYYESQGYAMFKHRDHLGRAVTIANFDKIPANVYIVDQAIAAACLMLMEVIKNSVHVQRIGTVFVFNMTGFEFGHAKKFRVGLLRVIARSMQGSFPVRIKAFHVVNCPKIISMVYAMIRPFIGEKMRNRMRFYGTDLTEFHQQVSPDILPHFLGGNVPDNEFADVEFSKRLVSLDDHYTDVMKYGYVKNDNEES